MHRGLVTDECSNVKFNLLSIISMFLLFSIATSVRIFLILGKPIDHVDMATLLNSIIYQNYINFGINIIKEFCLVRFLVFWISFVFSGAYSIDILIYLYAHTFSNPDTLPLYH